MLCVLQIDLISLVILEGEKSGKSVHGKDILYIIMYDV